MLKVFWDRVLVLTIYYLNEEVVMDSNKLIPILELLVGSWDLLEDDHWLILLVND